jgi:CheY-like chemotaxis protein
MARTETFDAALLDVNLNGEMAWDVADVLKARGIPFAFSTGYDQTDMLPAHLVGTPVFAKPYRIAYIENQLRQMMTEGAKPAV